MRRKAGRRLRPLLLGAALLGALAAAGCGEKSEPAIHQPTTAATTTTSPPPTTTTTPSAPTKPAPTPTAPVPQTTP